MLKLIIGKAGTGKTAAIIEEITAAVRDGKGRRALIVPEQYSHEAERELCSVCGDSLSLYAEVFSFSSLARRILSRQGGAAAPYLDKGGKLLCMALALSGIQSRLKVYSSAARKAELQSMLLKAVDELKAAGVGYDALSRAAAECDGALKEKLEDMALILEAYNAAVSNGHADPSDRLTVLAEKIADSDIGENDYFYIDGFIDFTYQELETVRALIRKGADVTACFTVDAMENGDEIYEPSRRAARALIRAAAECGEEHSVCVLSGYTGKAKALKDYADNMFSFSNERFEGGEEHIFLRCAESPMAECEYAAARAIELVRERGCRWRDIAVAVRGFDSYRAQLKSVFHHYGVPLFITRRSELMEKPLPALISLAYEIVGGYWDLDDVISYMRTGLTGLSTAECDTLENYIFKWQLRGGAWLRDEPWRQHPEGYGAEYTDETMEELRNINSLRERLASPLISFYYDAKDAATAAEQAKALAKLLETLSLSRLLDERAGELYARGQKALAMEYEQLWQICVGALEQCAAILGDTEMDMVSFGRLFTTMLSQYDVGTIPVSLDRVSAGDFDRMRRRSIKHLIVLGASEDRLPKTEGEGGVFSDDERQALLELDIDIGGAGEGELWREYALIYNCLSLPSETLTLCYASQDSDGGEHRAAYVYNRAMSMFGLKEERADISDARMNALSPALTLAAHAIKGGGAKERAAAKYFIEHQPQRFAALENAANMSRGRLSPRAVSALYGKRLRISASRADKFASCKFAYFCQYGLNAKPYEPAGFTPPEIGTFMHYVLEKTARAAAQKGGFKKLSDKDVSALTDTFVQQYVREELNDFHEKSRRFEYLFTRLEKEVRQVVLDMAQELRCSDFEPLSFELDFSRAGEIPPIELGEGEDSLTLTGIADRVDGWVHEGKLYLRVVDYKTGHKEFSLSDIWYGMGMQMLMYLFALEENGEKLYGMETAPAGVMYVPARDDYISAPHEMSDEELDSERRKKMRRSGLVLDDAALIEAWENGGDKRYIPIKVSRGKPSADSLASAERLGVLAGHIRESLRDMARELRRGSIAADPYYRSQKENACLNCDYFDVCHFSDGERDEYSRFTPKLSSQRVWELMEGGAKNE